MLSWLIEDEMIDDFAGRHVNHFDAAVIVGGNVDFLAVLREAHAGRKACAERDSVDNLSLAFIENDNRLRVSAHEERRRGRKTGEECK